MQRWFSIVRYQFALLAIGLFASSMAQAAAFSVATLSGTWGWVGFHFDSAIVQAPAPATGVTLPAPKGFVANEGTINFSGTGTFTRAYNRNRDGVVTPLTDGGTYTVTGSGAVDLTLTSGGSAGLVLTAQLNSAGDFLVGSSGAGTDPRSIVAGKILLGPYSLGGSGSFVSYGRNSGAVQPIAPAPGATLPPPLGFISFEGTTTLNSPSSISFMANVDGTQVPGTDSGSSTIDPVTGAISTLDHSGVPNNTGYIVNGNAILMATTGSGFEPQIYVVTLQSGTYSNASLKGRYAVLDRWFDPATTQGVMPAPGSPLPAPKGFKAGLGTMIADGIGNLTFNGSENIDGVVGASQSSSATYSVAPDGTVTLNFGGAPVTAHLLNGGAQLQWSAGSGDPPELVLAIQAPAKAPLGDLNADGKTDLLWHNSSTGAVAGWLMNGTTVGSSAIYNTVPLAWSIQDSLGDYNGDGKSDLLWRNTDGSVAVWTLNGTSLAGGAVLGIVPTAWSIVNGHADFDGDGKSDLLWHNTVTNQYAIWTMNGLAMKSGAVIGTVPAVWQLIDSSGDYNGDGNADLLWRNSSTGQLAIWLMNGTTVTGSAIVATVPTAWTVVNGHADFDGDGKSDLLWTNSSTNQYAVWTLNGMVMKTGAVIGTVPAPWSLIDSSGDYNGDGNADLLWRNSSTGGVAIWTLNGTTVTGSAIVATVPTAWQILNGHGDYDGDGKSDLLWFNSSTNQYAIWTLNGTAMKAGALIGTVPATWGVCSGGC